MIVMLICASGASSGYLVKNMNLAAKEFKRNDIKVIAKSEFEVENYLDSIDVLLIAPHLAYLKDELYEAASEFDLPTGVLSRETYGLLDGKLALEEVFKIIKEKKNE